MKTIIQLILLLVISCQSYWAVASDKCFKIFGKKYTDGQTVYIDCTVSNLYISAEYTYESTWKPGVKEWNVSTNFLYQTGQIGNDATVTFDPNKNDGHVSATFWEGNEVITVYITQRSTPTLTIAPTLCSPSQSGDFSTTLNFYGASTANVVWETTGGVTVMGGNFYRVSDNTISRATVQHNSYGTLTVYGEIPGCNNMRTNPVTLHIGTPSSSDITFRANPDPGSTLQNGQSYSFTSTINLPSQYSYNWSIPQGSSNVGYFYGYGPNVTVASTSNANPGGFIVQMDISNSICNTTGGTSRTFMKSGGGGYYRVANNPTSSTLTILFEPVDDSSRLPSTMRLTHEKKGIVKEENLKAKYSKESAKSGLQFNLDVHDLPKDTYYLQGVYETGEVRSTRIVVQ